MAKTALIVPLHKQSNNWHLVADGIANQTVKPHKVYVIVDRIHLDPNPTALEDIQKGCDRLFCEYEIMYANDLPTYMPAWDGSSEPFLAGHRRNIAINKALEDGCLNLIFIDGDCVPQQRVVGDHLDKLSNDLPIITIGRRREKEYSWKDYREYTPGLVHHCFFRKQGMLVQSVDVLKASLVVWSCNFAINYKAIKLIKKFNQTYYNRDELFNSEFDGAWGGEDGFLGLTAWLCRIFITTISDNASGVKHISHPRPSNKYSIQHKKYLDEKVEEMRLKIRSKPMDIDFFC